MLSKALREYANVSVEPITDSPRAPLLAEGATRAGVDVRRFPWIRPLSGAYAYDFPSVASLYAGDPQRPETWREVIHRVQAHRRQPEAIAAVLAAQQERRAAPPEARAAAAHLSDPATVAILTGQQAGAFGGPMYTILKAVTAIQLARRVAEEQRTPAIPIFWVDAEDHDWNEIASCTVLDSDFQPRPVTLDAPDGAGQRPVAALTLDERIGRAVDELATVLSPSPFTESVIASLRAAYAPGVGVAEAFARWIEAALGRVGVGGFGASDPAAKPLAAHVFARELRTAGRTASLAATAGASMSALGHAPQVEPQPDQPAVFRLDGTRTAIKREGDAFTIGNETVAAAALVAQAEQAPARFSPNVLLGPIVQDTLFPTICYVAGPSEMAYLAQLGGVYAAYEIPMPLIVPRASATLVDSAAARFLRRYPVALESLQPQDEAALNSLLKSQLPASLEQAMRAAADAVKTSMNKVIEV